MRWSRSSASWPSSPATPPSWSGSVSSRNDPGRSVELLDRDVPEPDRGPFRLPADRTAPDRGVRPPGDLQHILRVAVLGGEVAVGIAVRQDLTCVVLARVGYDRDEYGHTDLVAHDHWNEIIGQARSFELPQGQHCVGEHPSRRYWWNLL